MRHTWAELAFLTDIFANQVRVISHERPAHATKRVAVLLAKNPVEAL